MQGIGQFQQTNAQASSQAASVYASAAAFEANARIAQMNAASALEAGEASKDRRERIGRSNLAGKATSYLKAGISLAGSPLAVLGEEAAQEALAAQDILFDAQVKANQFENQAKLSQFNAAQARHKAASIEAAGSSRAGSSLLGSLSSTFRSFSQSRGGGGGSSSGGSK